jgi:hypothetical protein
MKKTGVSRRSTLLFSMLLLTAFLSFLGIFSPRKASAYIPPCGSAELRRTYYSDMAHTDVIGGWRFTCDCVIETWGNTSSGYNDSVFLSCPAY